MAQLTALLTALGALDGVATGFMIDVGSTGSALVTWEAFGMVTWLAFGMGSWLAFGMGAIDTGSALSKVGGGSGGLAAEGLGGGGSCCLTVAGAGGGHGGACGE